MNGMDRATTVNPFRPGSTLSWLRWVALVIAILCLSWNKARAVFSSELFNVANATALSRGSIDFTPFESGDDKMSYIYSMGFVSQTLLRNQFLILNVAPRLHMVVDTVLLPLFPEYQDTGIEYTSFPFNARAGLLYNYIQNEKTVLSFGVWLGGEIVSQYKKLYWGLEHSFDLRVSPEVSLGMKIQAAELEFQNGMSHALARAESGVSYMKWPFGIALSYLLEEEFRKPYNREYHTLKTGLLFGLSPRFILNAGFNYQLVTDAWNVSLGLDMPGVKLLKKSMSMGTALTYNPVGGFSFHMSLRWDPAKHK